MDIIYIDDSRDEKLCVFSALAIPADSWRAAFSVVRDFRHSLRTSDGIFVRTEFHEDPLRSRQSVHEPRADPPQGGFPQGSRRDHQAVRTKKPGLRRENCRAYLRRQGRARSCYTKSTPPSSGSLPKSWKKSTGATAVLVQHVTEMPHPDAAPFRVPREETD